VSVSGGEVLIRFSLTGSAVPLFYGTGTLSDAGQDYQLRVDTEAGRLVRNGYVSGRIVQVTANLIAIDFEDQYGGEPLNCEVSVESVQPAVPGAAGVAAQAGTAGVAAQAGTAGVAAQAGTAGVAAQAGTAASGSAQ